MRAHGMSAWMVMIVLAVVIRGELASGQNEDVRTNSNDINEDVQQPNEADQQISSELRAFLSRRSKHPSSSGSSRSHPHQQQQQQAVDSNWSATNPSSPSAAAAAPSSSSTSGVVTCHVEMQVVQRIPGRCIRLAGGRIRACQTPTNWLSLNAEECLDH